MEGGLAGAVGWVLCVVLGSAVGGVLRFLVSRIVGQAFGETFPWGTLVVNTSGAFVIGVLGAAASLHLLSEAGLAWKLLVVGGLGSYTTVSSFSLQTLALANGGEYRAAGSNILLSLCLCLGCAAAGFALGSLALPTLPAVDGPA